jgi:hypothetical protein
MRPLVAAVAVALTLAGTAAARNPRLERLAPRPADMELAQATVLRAADLGAGWAAHASKLDDTSPPDCAFQDYSSFTITGQAQRQYTRPSASVLARVEVYATGAQARGDFAIDLDRRTARCEGEALRARFATQSGRRVTLRSAQRLRPPALGDRSLAYRIVLDLHGTSSTLPLYVELVAFVRDRVAASVVVVTSSSPARGVASLVRAIDTRLQRAA